MNHKDSEPEDIAHSPRAPSFSSERNSRYAAIQPPEVFIDGYELRATVIKPGDTVELYDPMREPFLETMQSGDFLRIKHIIKNLETDEVRFRGYRMRRMKYLGPLFDCKRPTVQYQYILTSRKGHSMSWPWSYASMKGTNAHYLWLA